MSAPGPALGLIEGFFGPPWPEKDRLGFAPLLQNLRFDFYLYAPKADPYLRKKWREPWTPEYRAKLAAYARHFREHNVKFGVGLSPFELHLLGEREGKKLLQEKLRQLEDLQVQVLGLFFDDMPVHEDLARKQLEAIETVRHATRARIIFCPAFYTPDPILEKVFGKRPETYFDEIRQAPKEIDFAWTGPKVISDEISPEHLRETAALLGREPFLWDNLFANDGPRNCKFLKLREPGGRTHEALAASRGWAWNPMNQAALSGITLRASEHALVRGLSPAEALEKAVRESASAPLAEWVLRNRRAFLEAGLDTFSAEQKEKWRSELAAWRNEAVAHEIEQWLAGEFIVGAECLTD